MLSRMFHWLKTRFSPKTARKIKSGFNSDNPFLIL
ncbi:MAG: hypothetical protein JWP27_2722 [Flaviaesturariibacter sp.]|nr:hypothetical protein [Flaviaesturariibacter sp.]